MTKAVSIMHLWQDWAPNAPNEITCILRVSVSHGSISLHCAGLSTEPDQTWVKDQLDPLLRADPSDEIVMITDTFEGHSKHFAGPPHRLTGDLDDRLFFKPLYFKGKSQYINFRLSRTAIQALVAALLASNRTIDVLCDSYRGSISDVASSSTAFSHRNALYHVQFYAEWNKARDTADYLKSIRSVYDSLQGAVAPEAYVNYSDLDLANWEEAYWGSNLPRLQQVKKIYDPSNFFRHAQSVPISWV